MVGMRKSERVQAWAGEALWKGQPASDRSVRMSVDRGRFKAVGRAGRRQVFVVSGRLEQLQRFERQMARDGATVRGAPPVAKGGGARRPHHHGPIEESPPNDPRQPPSAKLGGPARAKRVARPKRRTGGSARRTR